MAHCAQEGRKISQREFAKALGVSYATYSRLELNHELEKPFRIKPWPKTKMKIAKVLGLNPKKIKWR